MVGSGRTAEGFWGDGKTWRGGFIGGGVLIGTLVGGAIQYFITPPDFYGSIETAVKLAFLLSFGALVGDLVGSFIKRRANLPRGGYPAIGLDQLGFLISALAFAYPVKTLSSGQIIFLLVVSPPFIHWGANYFAYRMGWKSVPW